jgi:PhnB protein
MTTLHPRLIVADPNAAIVSYEQALSATLFERFVDGEGRVVHAAMAVGDGTFSLAQTVPEWGLFDPVTLGGTASLVHLDVNDPDAVAAALVRAGGSIVVPIADRPWGKREGRVQDPFGHLWVFSKQIEDVTAEEIARRLLS